MQEVMDKDNIVNSVLCKCKQVRQVMVSLYLRCGMMLLYVEISFLKHESLISKSIIKMLMDYIYSLQNDITVEGAKSGMNRKTCYQKKIDKNSDKRRMAS